MNSLITGSTSSTYFPGLIVALARGVLGIHTPDDRFVPVEMLGPGIVERVGEDGWVRVLWLDPKVETWIDPADLQSFGRDAHIIAVYLYDRSGHGRRLRRAVDTKAGLQHNWEVHLLPGDVARTIRDDSWAWTFEYNDLLRRMNRIHSVNMYHVPPPSDDEAEALTVAELARAGLDIKETARSWQWVPVDY